MLESSIEGVVITRAERAGWFQRKVVWQGRKGAPDRVFIKDGRVVWIEFKRANKGARLTQELEHGRMRDAGAEVHVVDSIAQGLRILGLL